MTLPQPLLLHLRKVSWSKILPRLLRAAFAVALLLQGRFCDAVAKPLQGSAPSDTLWSAWSLVLHHSARAEHPAAQTRWQPLIISTGNQKRLLLQEHLSEHLQGKMNTSVRIVAEQTVYEQDGVVWLTCDSTERIDLRQTTDVPDETLLWGFTLATLTALQVSNAELSSNKASIDADTNAVVVMPHDLQCSRYTNALVLDVPCYRPVRASIEDVCVRHDWDLWCAPNVLAVLGANAAFANAVGLRLAETLMRFVPPECGGRVLAGLAGAALSSVVRLLLYPVMELAVAAAAAKYPELLYQGYKAGSCGCGGTTKTIHWRTREVLCLPSNPLRR